MLVRAIHFAFLARVDFGPLVAGHGTILGKNLPLYVSLVLLLHFTLLELSHHVGHDSLLCIQSSQPHLSLIFLLLVGRQWLVDMLDLLSIKALQLLLLVMLVLRLSRSAYCIVGLACGLLL